MLKRKLFVKSLINEFVHMYVFVPIFYFLVSGIWKQTQLFWSQQSVSKMSQMAQFWASEHPRAPHSLFPLQEQLPSITPALTSCDCFWTAKNILLSLFPHLSILGIIYYAPWNSNSLHFFVLMLFLTFLLVTRVTLSKTPA